MSEKAPHMSNGAPSGLRRLRRPVGLALIVVGVALLALVGGYYLYGIRAKAAVDDYSSERARPAPSVSASSTQPSPVVVAVAAPSPSPPATSEPRRQVLPTPPAAQASPTPTPEVPRPTPIATPTPAVDASGQRTGPSGFAGIMGKETPTAAPAESSPTATPTPDYAAVLEQYLQRQIDSSKAEALKYSPVPTTGTLTASALPATRIRIPAIGINSQIKELEVIDNGNSRAWETPKHVVGHIPTTAFPGDRGHGWYFGHLESPIRGEGNVFGRLPELAELFTSREESPFYVFLESEDLKFVYQIYRTEIVHRNDFALQDSGENDITLVTCYPRFIYDQRLLVTAALVGVLES